MGRVLTNNISLQVAREDSIGVLPGTPDWKSLEPNGLTRWGAETTTTPRTPISKSRQRRKGALTDLDSAVEYEADLTLDVVDDFVEGFCFSRAVNYDLMWAEANATGTGYTIPSATAAQGSKLQYTAGGPISLLYARGYATAANNGLKPLGADVGSTDTEITVSGLSAETAPSKAVLEVAGIRAEEGDLDITVSGTTAALTSGNNAASNNIDFTTLGLTVGQFIHVGGVVSGNQFSAGAGFARITAIAAAQLDLDKLDSALATDPGTGETVDLLFGRFVRNVSVDHADYLEQSFQFEAAFPNLGSGGATEYEYAKGNFANEMTPSLPLTDKAGVTFGFIGTDTETPTSTRKTQASSPRDPIKTAALNTTSDIARLRITEVDETGITTDFKSASMTLANNVSPEKVLGTLGAKYMNAGNFEVNLEAQALFTDKGVVEAIRDNTTLTMDFILKNDDGAIAVDVPSMTLGGGNKELPVNESVLISLTGEAFEDAALGTSLGVSLFPVVPA